MFIERMNAGTMKIIQQSGEGMQTIQQVPEVGICQKLLFPPIGEDTRERG